ncbi:TPA: hypothetical protein U1C81_001286 [Streptococcus suis]|uniref:hypothetical protein n=1 Tax=Streptococcus agalactiae TaxID=1311 RepID=UPI0006403FBA|nr:hypothetical protein [Streptococcus agalactiae]KLL81602.1 hypothetical protein WA05_09025 [Streptococcus agalactiae]HEM3667518.1 hypothetical protein [Streptococcus suis]
MTRTVRKNRSFEQKRKRPNTHQVGKQFRVSSNNKNSELNTLLRVQMLLKTNKAYRMAELQRVIGGLLVMGTLIYIFGCYVYYFSVTALKWYSLQFVNSLTLGLLKPSPLEQFHDLTFWEVYKRYSMGQPIIVGIIVILLLVIGVILSYESEEKQNMIRATVSDKRLNRDSEKWIKKGSVVRD